MNKRSDIEITSRIPNQGSRGSSTAYGSMQAVMYALAASGMFDGDRTQRVVDEPRPPTPKRIVPIVETIAEKRKRWRTLKNKRSRDS